MNAVITLICKHPYSSELNFNGKDTKKSYNIYILSEYFQSWPDFISKVGRICSAISVTEYSYEQLNFYLSCVV